MVMGLRLFCLLAVVAISCPALSHHSFAAEFDAKRPVTFKGKVTKVQWMNPHVHFYIDVSDQQKGIVNWDLESQSVNVLTRRGMTKATFLQVGDQITVDAYLAKDGTNLAAANTVKFADGITRAVGVSLASPANR